ncbi:MAG: acyl-CoA dehydrogenase [Dehalococcoidia bacterium]|nr:MAG: acyl-CoA dehydrogenase [Dehalococcoidia bacterium]
MFLLNPKQYDRPHLDARSKEIMLKTIEFFEKKGIKKIKQDDQAAVWYQDFLDFIKKEQTFADLLTPSGYGGPGARWDMWRIEEYNEILSFYGLCYWYAWQVTILGLGPIWMGNNEEVKHKTAKLLQEGGIFAFGLSERAHGADLYSSEMMLYPQPDGTYLARGEKYYIGNGNAAALVSTFGKIEGTGEYVFFVVDSKHPKYECVKKIDTSGVRQAYVSEYRLNDYPITDKDIISRGQLAWDSSLNTVNIGKFELGWASIGICTHCFYEAINHAAHRVLYGKPVTDFAHVKRLLTEAFARLVAMKLVALRAGDYFKAASDTDRRYLLYNPIVKMKVTTQGEKVVGQLHDIIAAKGFEQDTYFEMAVRDIGMLPKLEGTTHVNMALIMKFIQNYLFNKEEFPAVPVRNEMSNDAYLFRQFAGGLSKVAFPDYHKAYDGVDIPNVKVFREQAEIFREMLVKAPPGKEQGKNVDYTLSIGEIFTLIPYGQLVLENMKLYNIDPAIIDEIFKFIVSDCSQFALTVFTNHENSPEQEKYLLSLMKKPVRDEAKFKEVWEKYVFSLTDQYVMNE